MLKHLSEIKDLEIEKIIFNGFGLAHYLGKAILVYQGIPGDNVNVSLIHKRGETYFGNITKYNKKSPYQIDIPCEHFERCGGCDWLNIDYSTQLLFKQQIVEEVYQKYASQNIEIRKIIPSPKTSHYRNKIILPVTKVNGQIRIGMYERRSHNVIPHRDCYLHPDGSKEILTLTEELLTKSKITIYDEVTRKGTLRFIGIRYSETKGQYLLIIVTQSSKLPFSNILVKNITSSFESVTGIVQDINRSETNRNISANSKILFGNDYIEEVILGTTLRIHYSSFFQINTGQCVNLVKHISQLLTKDDIVIDAYSGIGTFGVSVAKNVAKVICLEQHSEAVSSGLFNIKENALDNCSYLSGSVEDTLSQTITAHQANCIILDPPRKGLENFLIGIIGSSSIKKIIYVSCNISTQKRDIELFEKMGFRLVYLQPFDMFPHTHHIECVALLEKL